MAKFKMELPTEIIKQMETVNKNADEIFGAMTRAGAAVVEQRMRDGAPDDLKPFVTHTRTYKTPSDGGINTKVMVKGYLPFSNPARKVFSRSGGSGKKYETTKGVPAEFLANLYEHGRSTAPWPKRPFMRKSFKRKEIEAAMLKAQSEASGGLLDE